MFKIGDKFKIGEHGKLFLIAGPCQIESREHALKIADFLVKLQVKHAVNIIYKSSFDKANRTSANAKRGPGIDEGLRILQTVRAESGLPILTDVHLPEQVPAVAEVVDVLQIPAFLCRQTDLLLAAGKSSKAVNIKKGQFLHPDDMRYAAEKVSSTGNKSILLCERGTCFGYRDLIVDMRSLLIMSRIGYPVVFDATHSVQQMGGAGGSSGGNREFIDPLVRAAVAAGVDGLFIECHDNPDSAPSDGPSMLPLKSLENLIVSALRIRSALLEK